MLHVMPLRTATSSAPAVDEREMELAALITEVAERGAEFRQQKQVSRDIVERLRSIGVYRMLVAAELGGEARSPAEFCRVIERISIADGSVGWVASFGVAAAYLAALPVQTLRHIYAGGPDVIFAGAMFPPQPTRRTADGLGVTGRWPFGSGSTGADLVGVGITVADLEDGKLPRCAVMQASDVTIAPNWDVIGLQGTGSHDIVVDNVIVSDAWVFVRGGRPSIPAAVYRYPTVALAAQVLAVVGLGIARGALDEITALANRRTSITGAPRLADRPYVQAAIATNEAELRAARALFYGAIEEAWKDVCAGKTPDAAAIAILRLAATHAAQRASDVARNAFSLAGTAAIYTGHRLATAMTDTAVIAQHAFLNAGTLEAAGRSLLDAAAGAPL